MVQRGEDFGCTLKASQPIRISGKRVREDLQGDIAASTVFLFIGPKYS